MAEKQEGEDSRTKKETTGPNPQAQITIPQAVRMLVGAVQSGRRQGLNSLQRLVDRDLPLQERLGRYYDVYTLGAAASREAATLPSYGALNSIQTNLAIDQFSGGDTDTMPSAQTMISGIDNGNAALNALSEQLKECCHTLTKLAEQNLAAVASVKKKLLEGFSSVVAEITNELVTLRKEFIEMYAIEKEKLNLYVTDLIESTIVDLLDRFNSLLMESEERLNESFQSQLNTLEGNLTAIFEEDLTAVEGRLNARLTTVDNSIQTLDSKIASLEGKINTLNNKVTPLDGKLDTLNSRVNVLVGDLVDVTGDLAALSGAFTTFAPLCLEAIAGLGTAVGLAFAGIETSVGAVEVTVKGKALVGTASYNKHIDSKIKDLKNFSTKEIDEKQKELKTFSEKKIKEKHEYWNDKTAKLPKLIASEASLAIIGEPYYRYDAISCYYPTICFIFYEVNPSTKPRRAQIKLRLKETTENLTTARITELKNKVSLCSNLIFTAGSTRANYVSADKRMKTTIYSKDASNARFILTSVFNLISDTFDESLLSITTNGTNRPNLSKRQNPLNNIGLNPSNYRDPFEVKLHQAHLVVNGLKEIIPIWESP